MEGLLDDVMYFDTRSQAIYIDQNKIKKKHLGRHDIQVKMQIGSSEWSEAVFEIIIVEPVELVY